MSNVAQLWADELPETISLIKKKSADKNPIEIYDCDANRYGANFFKGFGFEKIGEEVVDKWYNEMRYKQFFDDKWGVAKRNYKMCKYCV